MSDKKPPSAPLAYQNEPFLNSPDGRIIRVLSEYMEPLARFRREQIQDRANSTRDQDALDIGHIRVGER